MRKLVDAASKFLNDKVTKVVVTVPTYFNDSQRIATKDASRIIGLKVLHIINEPIAASLVFGLKRKTTKLSLFLTLEAVPLMSLFKVGNGVFEVLSTFGDTHLGGDDFDKVPFPLFLLLSCLVFSSVSNE